MQLRFSISGRGPSPALFWTIALAVLGAALAHAQDPLVSALGAAATQAAAKKEPARHPAEKDAVLPSIAIPVAPLGFAPPAPFYLGDRFAQVSLDFLDEDNLLFTFRVPGLIAREPAKGDDPPEAERHIRAVALALPSGKVTAEGLWVLHDYSRYLWVLKGGKFLLRDRNSVQMGDATLNLEPFLRFPGPVRYVEFDPGQDWMAADTVEPPAPEPKAEPQPGARADPASQPSSPAAAVVAHRAADPDRNDSQPAPQNLLRILNLESRKVLLFSRVSGLVHIPMDGEGYYEALRGKASNWLINWNSLQGGVTPVAMVESSCDPTLHAMAPGLVVATACNPSGARRFIALRRDRDLAHARLWEANVPLTRVWSQLTGSASGSRMACAALEVTHPVSPNSPLDNSDIRAQTVQVFDLATGKIALTVPASPILDGGGNFALSPSGNRFAVLNAGAIQVFDLPPAPPMPPPARP